MKGPIDGKDFITLAWVAGVVVSVGVGMVYVPASLVVAGVLLLAYSVWRSGRLA